MSARRHSTLLDVFWVGRRGDHFDQRCHMTAGPRG